MIYKLFLEQDIDIISYSDKSHLVREEWLFFDSSVFVELTNFFKPKSDRSVSKSMPELKELIIHLSSSNVNIHPLSLIEASREKRDEQKVFSEKKWIDHIHAFLLAQCVDIENSQLNSPANWIMSSTREELIISQFKYLYPTQSLSQLAEAMYHNLIHKADDYLTQIQRSNEKLTIPFLRSIHRANTAQKPSEEKIKAFFDDIAELPFCPKIVDYCLRLIFFDPKTEPLLIGALSKIKTELDHTAWDIVIFEQSQIANFMEPFDDKKPIGFFYTCDKNQFYYATLGKPLFINFFGNHLRFYYPKFQYARANKKCLVQIKEYYDRSLPEDISEMSEQVEHIMLRRIIQSPEILPDYLQFANQLRKVDFSKFSFYQNYLEGCLLTQ